MKKLVLFFLISSLSFLFAQSDYETTQDFKEKAQVIKEAIKNLHSKDEIPRIKSAISKLENDFSDHKDLLDKALYPDTFDKVFEQLNKSLSTKKNSLNKINSLENQITGLRVQITDLNDKNSLLIEDIRELARLRSNDSAKIVELNSKVRVLGKQIKERDDLVLSLVDSLLNEFINKSEPMTDASKNRLEKVINSRNLFSNIETTLKDNIDFLDLTVFNPEDLLNLKEQNAKFREVWDKLGPQLTDFYLNRTEKKNELEGINNLFKRWNEKIDLSVWNSINYYFSERDIKLLPYRNGNEFTANILAHITLEMNAVEKKPQEELQLNYTTFTDSVWAKEIRPNWMPLLIDNKYISKDQRNAMEQKLAQWEVAIDDKDGLTAIYVGLGIIFLIFVLVIFRKYKK